MNIRGQAAIVGIGEIPTRRTNPGRSNLGLMAEAVKLALDDAHLRKEDVDGLVTAVYPAAPTEYMGLRPTFATGVDMAGATGATCIQLAAAAIAAGYCETILVTLSQARDATGYLPLAAGPGPASVGSEFESWVGPAVAANNGYALIYARHMYEFGTKPEQFARMAANQRFNAIQNPNAALREPITVEDVLNSRYTNEPLHLLECVMPCAGAAAVIMTSADRAKSFPNRPVYVLGAGVAVTHGAIWQLDRMTTSPVVYSAPKAFTMAGYKFSDTQFAQFYD